MSNELMSVDIMDLVECYHLELLSQKIVRWEGIAYHLGLVEADVEAIKHDSDYDSQKLYMLQRWKRKEHANATYKVLHSCFVKHENGNLAEDLLKIMKEKVQPTSIIQRHQEKLKKHYKNFLYFEADHWPQSPFEAIYINLALIKQQRVKIGKIDDAFTRSTIHSCPDDVLHEKEPIELQDIFKFDGKEKTKCILIEAGPGLGKTMLSIKICKDWANGELLQDYDAVILLLLRCCKHAKNLEELLPHGDEEFKKEVVKEMQNNKGNRICFIVDGFDELPPALQKKSLFINLVKEFPNSLIIYTSRPVAAQKLRERVVSKRIEIIGFKSEQVKEYIEKALIEQYQCSDHVGINKASKIIKLINSYPYIRKLVHIPINLAILTHIFYYKKLLPSSHSQLYYSLVLCTILRYLRERKSDGTENLEDFEQLPSETNKQFNIICRLAFRGLQDSKLTFNTLDLESYCIGDIDGLGLLNIAPGIYEYGTLKSYHFMHLTLQEFCAAFYIFRLPLLMQFEIYEIHRDDPKFLVVWQFYAGLSKLATRKIFTSMIPSSNAFSLLHKSDIVQLLLCLYEANVPKLCDQAIGFMNGRIDLAYYEMDLLLCSALACFISNCSPGSIKVLNLAWCGIGDEGLQVISEALIQSYQLNSFPVNIDSFDLDVSFNDLTASSAHHIAKFLSSPCLVSRLVCTANCKLGDKGVETIINSAIGNHTLHILELRGCGIGVKAIHSICKLLKNKSNLKTLDISENSLDQKMLNILSESLANNHTLSNLKMKWCKFESNIAESVAMNLFQSSIINLDLKHNYIDTGSISNIVHALKCNSKLNSLNLDVNNITDDGVPLICELITEDLSSLSELYVSGNFQEFGIKTISNALTKNSSLRTLGLMPRTMSLKEKSSAALCKIVTSTSITSLHIVPPDNCSALSTAIASSTTLEELKVCAKSASSFLTLLNGIKQNTSIKRLDFLFTKMDRQWLKYLSDMLQVKTDLISLIVNGEVYQEDCVVLCSALLESKLLHTLTITPYKRIIPPTALDFFVALYTLESLECLTLGVDVHQTQGEGIENDEFSSTSKLTLLPKVLKEHVTIFRKFEELISSINERRCSEGLPELNVWILDK